nr:hypothetical protein CFP56_53053 [Quercus suber]
MRSGERNREKGRVRDISGQYHRQTLTTKIIASLNRQCTVTELKPPELQAHRKKPLGHTSAAQIVETGSGIFSFHFLDLDLSSLLWIIRQLVAIQEEQLD